MGNFVAIFNKVNNKNGKFTEDKNGNLPLIGTIVAGKSHTSLINGSVFEERNLIEGSPYWCTEEKVTVRTKTGIDAEVWNINVIGNVTPLQAMEMEKVLGAGKLIIDAPKEDEDSSSKKIENAFGGTTTP